MTPLPILLLILASASANIFPDVSDHSTDLVLPEVPLSDKIPAIKEFDDPQFLKHEYAGLTTLDLVKKHGYAGELHQVTTTDGYILELHRITGRANLDNPHAQKPVVFVMHGLLCSSACWVVTGTEKGLAYILANEGYDVWLGNARGTIYSRKHVIPNISNAAYWDFSWHEVGMHDLPAMIDYIAKTTGQKILYLGHSMGTTAFFVMASERPEYQDKIQAMFAMAPVAYCGRMPNPILQFISRFNGPLTGLMKLLGMHEFLPNTEALKLFEKIVCAEGAVTQPLCRNVLFMIAGFNEEQFDNAMLPIILEHVPAGAATKQIMHYAQLITTGHLVGPGKFRQYDYTWFGNLIKYKSFAPPEYNLRKIRVPVALHYGTNDWLASVNDVDQLYKELSNSIGKFRVPHEKFNHLDFMWAKDIKVLLYDKMLSLMKNFVPV